MASLLPPPADCLAARLLGHAQASPRVLEVVGGAFEDRISAIAKAAAAAEKRAAECEAELANARLMKEDEAAQLEARVHRAIGKKDETIAQLTAQLNATKALLEEAPMCLED